MVDTNELGENRWASLNTDASGNQVMRIPLATTVNDFSVGEGVALVGGIGAGTVLVLATIAHAVFTGKKKRRRRDVSSVFEHVRDDLLNNANAVFRTDFSDIYESDSNWCGLRLTCELAVRAGAALDEDEKMIISYFKGVVSADDLKTMKPPELYYAYASFIGFSQGSMKKCRDAYGKCPYDSRRMMAVYKAAYEANRKNGAYQDTQQAPHAVAYLPQH